MTLIGPFSQLISLNNLPLKGKLNDEQLNIIQNGGILVRKDGMIEAIDDFELLRKENPTANLKEMSQPSVALPGFIDCHTHICFAGNRAGDFAMRLNGKSYLEIAESGGGIWNTVTHTRSASQEHLTELTTQRAHRLFSKGITTIEVKSGYALSIEDELKMLRAIKAANEQTSAELIPTFLGAHIKPKKFSGNNQAYLELLAENIFPVLKSENLSNRIDIFVEQSAFGVKESKIYLEKANAQGFQITVHADQFSTGGSELAVMLNAVSADHLEASTDKEIALLAGSETVSVALPGASVGLGEPFAPARKILDAGGSVAIASDWNPGSAPMGDLLTQACILATYEKLSLTEVLAGITFRAAHALRLNDRGTLTKGNLADLVVFPTNDFREIFYTQGQIHPTQTIKNGIIL